MKHEHQIDQIRQILKGLRFYFACKLPNQPATLSCKYSDRIQDSYPRGRDHLLLLANSAVREIPMRQRDEDQLFTCVCRELPYRKHKMGRFFLYGIAGQLDSYLSPPLENEILYIKQISLRRKGEGDSRLLSLEYKQVHQESRKEVTSPNLSRRIYYSSFQDIFAYPLCSQLRWPELYAYGEIPGTISSNITVISGSFCLIFVFTYFQSKYSQQPTLNNYFFKKEKLFDIP